MSYAALYLRSAMVLAFLFALFLAGSAVAGLFLDLSLGLIFLIAALLLLLNFFLSPWIIDWIYAIEWIRVEQLPPGIAAWVHETCQRHGKPVPRFGIIQDGAPNAFTYGNWPSNARLVLTQGLVDSLDEEELKAVIAHEMGHIFHYDFVVMTVASFIPLFFYYLYRIGIRWAARRGGSRRDQSKAIALAVAIGALVVYYISHYTVLFLSRTREYFADAFAGQATGRPDKLASALVKIAYGLVGAQASQAAAAREEGAEEQSRGVALGGALAIFDTTSAKAVVVAAQTGTATQEAFSKAARWELWNPWAMIYELQSTHPLAVKRIKQLSAQAEAMGMTAPYTFAEQQPESFWDEFLVDLLMHYLPWISGLAGLVLALSGLGATGGALWGIGLLLSTWFRYRSDFQRTSILQLLGQVKVSGIRPAPAVIEGQIIGRGQPGYFLSEDLVLQDDTGYILMDYRQPGAIFEWFFALFRAKNLVGGRARVHGWYRRAPVPYFEIRKLETEDGRTFNCYVYHVRMALAILAPLLLAGLGMLLQP